MYDIRILKPAVKDLEKLDKVVAKRVVEKMNWLAQNLDEIRPQQITGELRGLYKLREGDYRVIYEIIHKENLIVIHCIGHRREIYRKSS
ncbi:MAG TPA: type II toxin-antitoxin system RelE/ParE family toxin [Thermoguttaceae bacterium]